MVGYPEYLARHNEIQEDLSIEKLRFMMIKTLAEITGKVLSSGCSQCCFPKLIGTPCWTPLTVASTIDSS